MNWVGLSTVIHREVTRILKVANQALFPPVISSLLYLAIFHFVIGKARGQSTEYLAFLVPGLVMMSVVNNAYQNSAFSVFIAKYSRYLEHVLTMPLSYRELVLGILAGGIVRGGITAGSILIATAFFVTPQIHSIGAVLAYFLLACIIFGSLGIIIALWAEQFDHLGVINTFVLTPLSMLGGVFYSISVLPPTVQFLTLFNPVFYLVDGFRYGILGSNDAPLWLGALVLGVLAAACFSLTVHLMGRGWHVKE
ncbi:ABC transporter permease [Candidatus Woesearchaeota archaeon]|nr:MAG: ABC transporter permease [Candidatus Woesearchaeota archaeon]